VPWARRPAKAGQSLERHGAPVRGRAPRCRRRLAMPPEHAVDRLCHACRESLHAAHQRDRRVGRPACVRVGSASSDPAKPAPVCWVGMRRAAERGAGAYTWRESSTCRARPSGGGRNASHVGWAVRDDRALPSRCRRPGGSAARETRGESVFPVEAATAGRASPAATTTRAARRRAATPQNTSPRRIVCSRAAPTDTRVIGASTRADRRSM
jgi:hypothetical protein